MELNYNPDFASRNEHEVDHETDSTVCFTASESAQETVHPLNLFQESSEVLKFLNGNDSEFLKEVVEKIGYQVNFFSIQDGANVAALKLRCKVCDVTLSIKNIEKHVGKKQHLELVGKRCVKGYDGPETFISDENWNYLDFLGSSYRCSLCDVPLSDDRSSWAKHFQSDVHRIRLKDAKPDIILSTVNCSSIPSSSKEEKFDTGYADSEEIFELLAENEGVQISTTSFNDHESASSDKSWSSVFKDSHSDISFGDLIGVQNEDLHFDHKKVVKQLGDKLKEKLHYFKLNYTNGLQKLYFICKVCTVHLTPTKVEQHLATPHHTKSLQKDLIASPFESFNDSDKKIITDLSDQFGSHLNFFALTFRCGSNRLCLVCYPCSLVLLPPNVKSHFRSDQHWNRFDTNLFSLHFDSLNLSNKKMVRELTSKISDKMNHFSLVHKIGTTLLCFYCKYCQVFVQEQDVPIHVHDPRHIKAMSQKPKGAIISDSVKIKDGNSEHVPQSVSKHKISLQEDPIGLQVKELNSAGRKFFQKLVNKLQHKINFYKITSWNGSDNGFLTCKVCNVVVLPDELEHHPERSVHLKNLPKNLAAVKLESFNQEDNKLVKHLTNQLSGRIYFSSLIFQCGSSKLCFVCNLCNTILMPRVLVIHFQSQQHLNNFDKNLFSLSVAHMNDANKEVVKKIKQKINNNMEVFNFIYKIGSNKLRFHCRFCGHILSAEKIEDHVLSPQHFEAVPQKFKDKISSLHSRNVTESRVSDCSSSTSPGVITCSSQNFKNTLPSEPKPLFNSQEYILGLRFRDLNGEAKKILEKIITERLQNIDQIHFYKIAMFQKTCDKKYQVHLCCKVCNVAVSTSNLGTHLQTKAHVQNLRYHLFAVNLESISDLNAGLVRKLASKLSHRKYFFSLTFQCGSDNICFVCNICNQILLPRNVSNHVKTVEHLKNLDKDLFSLHSMALSNLNKDVVEKITSKIGNKIDYFKLVYLIGTTNLQFYCKYCHYALQEKNVEKHTLMEDHLKRVSKERHAKIAPIDAANIKESQSSKHDLSAVQIASSKFSESNVNVLPACKNEIFSSGNIACQDCGTTIRPNNGLSKNLLGQVFVSCGRNSAKSILLEAKTRKLWSKGKDEMSIVGYDQVSDKSTSNGTNVSPILIRSEGSPLKPSEDSNEESLTTLNDSSSSSVSNVNNSPTSKSEIFSSVNEDIKQNIQVKNTISDTQYTKKSPISGNDKICKKIPEVKYSEVRNNQKQLLPSLESNSEGIKMEEIACHDCKTTINPKSFENNGLPKHLLDHVFVNCRQNSAKTILSEAKTSKLLIKKKDENSKMEQDQVTNQSTSNCTEMCPNLIQSVGSPPKPTKDSTEDNVMTLLDDMRSKVSQIAKILRNEWGPQNQCAHEIEASNDSMEEVKIRLLDEISRDVAKAKDTIYREMDPTNWPSVNYTTLDGSNKEIIQKLTTIIGSKVNDLEIKYSSIFNKISFYCKYCRSIMSLKTAKKHVFKVQHVERLHLNESVVIRESFKNESEVVSSSSTKEKSSEPARAKSSHTMASNEKHPVTHKENEYQSSRDEKGSFVSVASNNYSATFSEENRSVCTGKNELKPTGHTELKEKSAVQDDVKSSVALKSNSNHATGCEGDENLAFSPMDGDFVALGPSKVNLAQKLKNKDASRNREEMNPSPGCPMQHSESSDCPGPNSARNSKNSGVDHVNQNSSQMVESIFISGSSGSNLPPKNEIVKMLVEEQERKSEDSSAAQFTRNECSAQNLNENGAISFGGAEGQWSKGSSITSKTEPALKLNENPSDNRRVHTGRLSELAENHQVPTILGTSGTCVSKVSNQDLPDSGNVVKSKAQALDSSETTPFISGNSSESSTLLKQARTSDKIEILEILKEKIGDRINEVAPFSVEASKFGFKCKVCWDTVITPKNVAKHIDTEMHLKYLPLLKLQNFETMTDLNKAVVKSIFKKINDRIFHFHVTNVDELKRLCFVCQFCHVTLLEDGVLKHGCLLKNPSFKLSKYSKDVSTSIESAAMNELTASIGHRIEEFSIKYEDSKLFFECKVCGTNLPPTKVKSHVNSLWHSRLRPLMKLGIETLNGKDKQTVAQIFCSIDDRIFDFRLLHCNKSDKLWFVCKDCSVYLSPQKVTVHDCHHVTFHFHCRSCSILQAGGDTLENHVVSRQHLLNLWSTCPFTHATIRAFEDFDSVNLSLIKSLASKIGFEIACFDFLRSYSFGQSNLKLFCKVCKIELYSSSAEGHLTEFRHKQNLLNSHSSISSGWNTQNYVASEIFNKFIDPNIPEYNWKTTSNYCELCEVLIADHVTLVEHADSEQHLENLPAMRDKHLFISSYEELNAAELTFLKSQASRIGAKMHCFDYIHEENNRQVFDLVYCRVCASYVFAPYLKMHLEKAAHLDNLNATCFGRFKVEGLTLSCPPKGNDLAKQILMMNSIERDVAGSAQLRFGSNQPESHSYDAFGLKSSNLSDRNSQSPSNLSRCSLM